MDLMKVEEMIALLEAEGVKQEGEKISDIILGLGYCNRTTQFEERYKNMVTLAGLVRDYMELEEGQGQQWPGLLLQNMMEHISDLMADNQQSVPKIIHFVWIGSPIPQVVMNYIRIWAKINPDYGINIWYDSDLLGLKKLSDLLKETVGGDELRKTDNEIWADAVFRIRQDFTNFVLEHNPGFENMSQTMKDYFVDLGKKEEFAIEPVWQEELPFPNIQLRDIREADVFTEEIYPIYMMEAVQTQNFAALSDMVRLLVLKKFGGVYLDTDMLPEIEPSLMAGFSDESESTRQRLFLQAIMEDTEEISDYSNTKFLESYGRKKEIRDIVAGKSLEALMVPLGDIKCNPRGFRIFHRCGSVINQMLACFPNSMAVDMLLTLIKQNYDLMNQYFEKPPFLGIPLEKVTKARKDVVDGMPGNELSYMLSKIYTYYKTGLIPEIRCTIALTGPTIYVCIMCRILFLENNWYKGLLQGIRQNPGYESFFIPSDKLAYETEEENNSSWQAEKQKEGENRL